jgi:NADPH:quinone reductase-like Zn-dependent oxidoreductase
LEDIPRPPFIPGFECSGEVLDIGTNVTHVDVRLKFIYLSFDKFIFREVIVFFY